MNPIRNTDVMAIDLTAIDFTLQFARQVDLPCKKGVNIRMMQSSYDGVVQVSVGIVDLKAKKQDLSFCIQENPIKGFWEPACIYPVNLTFGEGVLESELPPGFKHANRFRAKRDKTAKYTFINLTDNS